MKDTHKHFRRVPEEGSDLLFATVASLLFIAGFGGLLYFLTCVY